MFPVTQGRSSSFAERGCVYCDPIPFGWSVRLYTVFYVGVVPEMRGRGYVDDLLAAGTATLLDVRSKGGDEKPLRADTDVANAPMAAAFERAGWARFARRREYGVDL